jgi:addiction module RelB/DinJ family antitoxin
MSTTTKSSLKTVKKTKVIQTRLDADLVDRANEILEHIGLTSTDIFRILLKKVVNTGEVPLSLVYDKPYFNEEQSKQIDEALDDIENGRVSPAFTNSEEAMQWLEDQEVLTD